MNVEQSFGEAVSNNWRRSILSTSLSTPSLDLSRAPAGHGQRILMHNPDESYIEQHEKKLEMMGASAKEVLAQATQSIGDHLSSIMSTALLQLKSDIANRKMYVMFEELLHCDVRTDHTQARSVLPIFEPFIDRAGSFLNASFYHFIKKEVEYCVVDCISKHIQEHESDMSKIFDLTIAFAQSQLMSNMNELAKNSVVDAKLAEKASFLTEIVRLKEMLFQKRKIGDMYLAETQKSKRLLLKLMRSEYVEYGQTLHLKDILLRGSERKKEIEEAVSAIELEKTAKESQQRLEMLAGNDTLSSSGSSDDLNCNDLDVRQTRGQLMDKLQRRNAYISQLEDSMKMLEFLKQDLSTKTKELNTANEATFKANYRKEELEKYLYKLTGIDMRSPQRQKEKPYTEADFAELSDNPVLQSLTGEAQPDATEKDTNKSLSSQPSALPFNKRSIFEPKDLLIDKLNGDIKLLESMLSDDKEALYAELRRYRANELQHRRKIMTYKRFLEFDHGKRGKDHPITGFEARATPLAIDKQLDMLYWIRKAMLKIFGIKIKDSDSEQTILKRLNRTIAENYINPEPQEFNSSFDSDGSIDWEGDIAAEKRLQLNPLLDPSMYSKGDTASKSMSMRTPGRGWMPNLGSMSSRSTGHRNSTLADPSQPDLHDTPIRFQSTSHDPNDLQNGGGYYDQFGNFLGTDIFCPHCGQYVDATAITYSIDDGERDEYNDHEHVSFGAATRKDSDIQRSSIQSGASFVTPSGSRKRGARTDKTTNSTDKSRRNSSQYASNTRTFKGYVRDPSVGSPSPAVSMRVRFGDNLTSTISMDPLTIPQLKSSQPQLSTVLAPDVTHVYTHLSTSDRQKFEHALFKQNIAKKGNPGLCQEIEKELTPLLVSSIAQKDVNKILAIPCSDPDTPTRFKYDASLDDSFVNYIEYSDSSIHELEFSDARDPDLFSYLYRQHAKTIGDSLTIPLANGPTDLPGFPVVTAQSVNTNTKDEDQALPSRKDSTASDGFIAMSGNFHRNTMYSPAELFNVLLLTESFRTFIDSRELDPRVVFSKDIQAYVAAKKIPDIISFYNSYCKDDQLVAEFSALPEFSEEPQELDMSFSSDDFCVDVSTHPDGGVEGCFLVSRKADTHEHPQDDTTLQQSRRPLSHAGHTYRGNLSAEEVCLDPLSPLQDKVIMEARPASSPCRGYVTVNGIDLQLSRSKTETAEDKATYAASKQEYSIKSREILKQHLPLLAESSSIKALSMDDSSHKGDIAIDNMQIRPLCKNTVQVISHERAEKLQGHLSNEIREFKLNRAIQLFIQEQVLEQIVSLKRALQRSHTRERLMRDKRRVLAAKKALFIKYLQDNGPGNLVSSLDVLEDYALRLKEKAEYAPMPVVASCTDGWIVNPDMSTLVNRTEPNSVHTTGRSSEDCKLKSNELSYLVSLAGPCQSTCSAEPLQSTVHVQHQDGASADKRIAVEKELEDLDNTTVLAHQLLEQIKTEIQKAVNMINKGIQSPQGLIDEENFDVYASERIRRKEEVAIEIANNLFRKSGLINKGFLFTNLPLKATDIRNIDDVYQRLYDEAAIINEKMNSRRIQCMQELSDHYSRLHDSVTRPSEITEFLRIKYYGREEPVSRYNYHHHGMFTNSLHRSLHGLPLSKRPLNGGLTTSELELLESTNVLEKGIQLNEKTSNIINVIFGNLYKSKSTGARDSETGQKSLMMGPGRFVSWQEASAELQEIININNRYSLGIRGYHSMGPVTPDNLGTIGRSAIEFPPDLTDEQLEQITPGGDYCPVTDAHTDGDVVLDAPCEAPPPHDAVSSTVMPLNSSLINEVVISQNRSHSGPTQNYGSSINDLSTLHEGDDLVRIAVDDNTCENRPTSSSLFTVTTPLMSTADCPDQPANYVEPPCLSSSQATGKQSTPYISTPVQKQLITQTITLAPIPETMPTIPPDTVKKGKSANISSRKIIQAIQSNTKSHSANRDEHERQKELERRKGISGMKFTINTVTLDPVVSSRTSSRPTPSAVSQRSASSKIGGQSGTQVNAQTTIRTNSSYQTPLPSLATATTLQDVTAPVVALSTESTESRIGNRSHSSIGQHKMHEELAPLSRITRSQSTAEKSLELSDLQPLPQLPAIGSHRSAHGNAISDPSRASGYASSDLGSTFERVVLDGLV
ncbi:hypothetical protein QR46_2259 [Giardia duodenalis assemblage B]|uniref:Uncharacterized protein n=1 Tax=Giardia duodenalis assemblage B TaxID=1394984 RepID=A0A132NUH5_GIAIN|nr:hypothetical protein QR46_2259 [Giardia intestinalis assemblage B]